MEPHERYYYCATVYEAYDERIIINAGDLRASLLNFKHRKPHSNTPATRLGIQASFHERRFSYRFKLASNNLNILLYSSAQLVGSTNP